MSGGQSSTVGRAQVNRADLIRALAAGKSLRDQLAELLGFERRPLDESNEELSLTKTTGTGPQQTPPSRTDESTRIVFDPRPVSFWRAESFHPRKVAAEAQDITLSAPASVSDTASKHLPRAIFEPLATMADLLTRLRRLVQFERPGGQLDVRGLVTEFSRGRIPVSFPRQPKRSWGAGLHVIQDLSTRLIPYRIDQGLLSLELKDLLPKSALTLSTVREADLVPFVHWPDELLGELVAAPGSSVLVLGDLGVLNGTPWLMKQWKELGKRLADQRVERAALVPCDLRSIPEELADVWGLLPWDRFRQATGEIANNDLLQLADRLLALLSFAVVIEPRLLRRVRRAVPEFRQLVELESLVWQHRALREPGLGGAIFHREQRAWLESLRAEQSEELRRLAVESATSEHQADYIGIRYTETLNLGDEATRFFSDNEIRLASDFFKAIDVDLPLDQPELRAHREFFGMVASHLTRRGRKAFPVLDRIWARCFQDDPQAIPPADLDPAQLLRFPGPERLVQIGLAGTQLTFSAVAPSETVPGSPLARLRTGAERIRIDLLSGDAKLTEFNIQRDFWADGESPVWAKAWGVDGFGPWAEFQVGAESTPVRQRMRWVAAGSFWMGSPDEEPGRFRDEGPRHEVMISRGFWLFDTPCTQALWEMVSGENPSKFQSSTRPVESVSWDACQQFLTRVRELVPVLQVDLPTEAEWEYACRAGTTAATYAGPIEILGENNAPVLDAIAWYGGNSGVGFDLENGNSSSDWIEKQFEFEKAGTNPVATKAANPWGLYDMLGNVWEWCRDGKRIYESHEEVDPLGPIEASAYRVVRGGSWGSDARLVRAACRSCYSPGDRHNYLGFRCRVQGCEPSQAAAEPTRTTERAVSSRSGEAEPRGDSETTSAVRRATGRRGSASTGEYSENPSTTSLSAQSFLEALARIPLSRLPQPNWACLMERDEFGLYAEFEVPAKAKRHAIRQRLRLIPPGTFWMGSPVFEDGRFDFEGPQHQVTISQAFWLLDAPCIQALWEAVSSTNQSDFKGSDRPVENVSWNDCQRFHERLGRIVASAEFDLPSEAEWEYACRAGTTTATYAGNLTIENPRAKELEQIAWYAGNRQSGTQPVRRKQPNPLGLYDMLGNVWEWCRDGKRIYESHEEVDPLGPIEASAGRVVRGGSWADSARYVRAACRYWYSPGHRSNNGLGFRCRVQALELQQAVTGGPLKGCEGRASVELPSRKAEPGGDSETASVARAAWVNLKDRGYDQTPIPPGQRVRIVTDLEELTLCQVPKPTWASAMGRDRFGLWAELEVPLRTPGFDSLPRRPRAKAGVVTQRLRWIPPGQYLMGSPQNEPGRYDDESEPTPKVIPRGFWLFDTPCTQALWQAVLEEDNPSFFQSPDRPVEQVTWEDCQRFIRRMPTFVRGMLSFSLPTESEWEYACRAGTETASYAGPVELLGDANAPALDPIAWYGGNSGVDFDLPNGIVVDWQKEKQHSFEKGGTHPVASKLPNAWGLYDILGNVWEWCADVRHLPAGEVREPVDPAASADRVVRGGSWFNSARSVRAACRYWYSPERRYYHLGFRCRVQESERRPATGSWHDGASAERQSRTAEPGVDSAATSGVSPADETGKRVLG